MSDQTEPLAAVLAEMRKFTNVPYEHLDRGECRLLDKIDDYADRIEAAAKRERENADLRAIHRCHDCERENTAHGNAAAMRESIETMRRYAMLPQEQLSLSLLQRTIHEKCDAALAVPARNCDRFVTEDEAREAYWAYREPLEFNNKPFVAITEWLFADAEGGAE